MHVSVPMLPPEKFVGREGKVRKGKTSKEIQKGVQKARDVQSKRFKGTKFKSNAEMSTKEIKYCRLTTECKTLLRSAVASMSLSARAYHKVTKTARTVADLVGDKDITINHLSEALQYRPQEEDIF